MGLLNALFRQARSIVAIYLIHLSMFRNVLYSELTARQHVHLFRALKHRRGVPDSIDGLLASCDLAHKFSSRPDELSGGQKRKLQVSLALVGGSQVILADESTSGLDPLSRRAIWSILLSQRGRRTTLLTSHFLDEADILADHILIVAAPGKKLCEGSPVSLKESLGEGSFINVLLQKRTSDHEHHVAVLEAIAGLCPGTRRVPSPSPAELAFFVPTQERKVLGAILRHLEAQRVALGIGAYDVAGPSLESVFLRLNAAHAREQGHGEEVDELEKTTSEISDEDAGKKLSDGKPAGWIALSWAVVRKRLYVFKRAWFAPLLAVLVAILGSIVPLAFLSGRNPSCARGFTDTEFAAPVFFPEGEYGQLLFAPPDFTQELGQGFPVDMARVEQISLDNFTQTIDTQYRNLSLGGVAFVPGQAPLLAYRADTAPQHGLTLLNLITNAQMHQSVNTTGTSPRIYPSLQFLSALSLGSGLGGSLKWAVVYGLVQAVWPAFMALYPTNERVNRVKALQLTNGLRPLPLWTGHLLADLPIVIIASVAVAAVYGAASDQFEGEGTFWVVLWLYGLAASLQSYCVSLFAPSALAAFAIVAAWNVIAFLLYFAATL